ncbi:histidine phosphatase family protein [bacterium]|nr:histidine phosphatase family protein [bacterium]MBP9807047.1 histidine phosphatase family protein [bacterium]
MKLILARHGNTFAPGDKVTWVGSANDLPLVESGLEQAERAATALEGTKLAAIYCAPLLRTKKFAEIVAARQTTKTTPIIDNRLTELDYGDWSGLSDDEISAKFGDSLKNWINTSTWPSGCHWASSEAAVTAEVQSLVAELETKHADEAVLLVSSNGRLRYFLKLIAGEFERRVADKQFKMGTGKISVLSSQGKIYSLLSWNQDPAALKDLLCAARL